MVFKTYKMNDMKGKQGLVCMGLLLVLSSCHTGKQITASGLQRKDFQTEVNGQHTDLFTLSNKQGMEVCITNYGARVVSILVPDRNGKREDVVCGFSTITEYMEQRQNVGKTAFSTQKWSKCSASEQLFNRDNAVLITDSIDWSEELRAAPASHFALCSLGSLSISFEKYILGFTFGSG